MNESLQNYIYTGKMPSEEREKEWSRFHVAILMESDERFFERDNDDTKERIERKIRYKVEYLNLNPSQSLLLFENKSGDFRLIAEQIYTYLRRVFGIRIYYAISRYFEDIESLPAIFRQLENQMALRHTAPEEQVFDSDEQDLKGAIEEVQDSQILTRINEDVRVKNIAGLWHHFNLLAGKYRGSNRFSAMYVKFVFSSVLQELSDHLEHPDDPALERDAAEEVEKIYRCTTLPDIIDVVEDNVRYFETCQELFKQKVSPHIQEIIDYIRRRSSERLELSRLSAISGLKPADLCYMFQCETGKHPFAYLHQVRLEKADRAMHSEMKGAEQAAREAGFKSTEYFLRTYGVYYS